MNKNTKYYILPGIQGIGAVIFFLQKIELPNEMALKDAILLIVFLAFNILLFRIIWILLSSYIINISKIIIYRIEKREIISYCIFPVFSSKYNEKKSFANIFWVYDDRTCFSVENYLHNVSTYKALRKYINKHNRKLALIYFILSVATVTTCIWCGLQMVSWIFAIGALEHFLYQSEFSKKESANGMAFASLSKENDNLIMHILANQSKIEPLKYSSSVAEYLSNYMFDCEMGYFFNYLCLSNMFREIYDGENSDCLITHMNRKVQSIINEDEVALDSIKYLEKDVRYKYIDKKTCLFYENYREFLLYVLMYYRIRNNVNYYKQLKNYIQNMLDRIENQYVDNTYLSNFFYKKNFMNTKICLKQL